MSAQATLETFISTPVTAITLIDQFIQLRGSGGAFPPPLGSVGFEFIATLPQGGAVSLDPPIVLTENTNGSGVFLFAGDGTIGDSPELRIPAGRYRLQVTSDYYQSATVDLDWPPDLAAPPTILLKPAFGYPFPDLTIASNQLTLLSGNLYRSGGDRSPIAGAVVTITAPANNWPFGSSTTDDNGGWVLVIPQGKSAPAFNATLHFQLPDNSAFDVAAIPVEPGAANSLPQTALRGSVLNAAGAPISGAAITVSNIAGSSTSSRDGSWSFYMSLTQTDVQALVSAVAPSGQNQSQNVQIRNRTTVLVPAFQIATQYGGVDA
jgi:hypothetical protein